MRRKGTSKAQFVQHIPADVRPRASGLKLNVPVGAEFVHLTISPKAQAVRLSPRTAEPGMVKLRQMQVASYLETVWQALRVNQPVTLTHRQAVALSGELYREWSSDPDPSHRVSLQHTDGGWVRVDGFDSAAAEYASVVASMERLSGEGSPSQFEATIGPIVDRLLLKRGIAAVDGQSREMLLTAFITALRDGIDAKRRKAEGDYSPDAKAARFPECQALATIAPAPKAAAAAAVSLTGILESWWREAEAAGRSESTHDSYSKAVERFVEFPGHDDASRVSPKDVVAFKDRLLETVHPKTGKKLTPKTVKDSYLSGLKSVFGWAVTNQLLPSNPAQGLTIKMGKKTKLRDTWFTSEEVRAILSASSGLKFNGKEPPQRHALKRWVPWLCAYTGARVGEIVQLRKQDVRREGDHWIINITPEAGRVKSKESRVVPVHEHLIDQGFLEFVKAAPDGHLFMWSGTEREAWRSAKNRLTAFVRDHVTDPNVQPNHGWRHTFKTVGSEAGIQDKVLDAICGHDPRTVGEGYGGVTLMAKVKAMAMFPRFVLEPIALSHE